MTMTCEVVSRSIMAFAALMVVAVLPYPSLPETAWATAVGSCPASGGWARLAPPAAAGSHDPSKSVSATPEILSVAAGWTEPEPLYVGGNNALYQSVDCGATWTAIWESEHLTDGGRIAQSARNLATGKGGRIYFDSFWPQHLTVSRDSGSSWQDAERLGSVGVLAVAPSQPDTVYVFRVSTGSSRGPFPGVRRTTDGGLIWETMSARAPDGEALVDPSDPLVVYSLGQGVILRSTDGAQTFDPYAVYGLDDMPEGATIVNRGVGRAAMSADGSHTWFISVTGAFYRGLDRASTWSRLENVPFGGPVRSVSASPRDPKVLFAVSQADELWAYREPESTAP